MTINAYNGAISLDKDSSVHFNRDKNGVEHKDLNGNPIYYYGLYKPTEIEGARVMSARTIDNPYARISSAQKNFPGDWDGDGDLGAISRCTHYPHGNTTMHFMENVSIVAGQYQFTERGDISNRTLNQHEVRATVCDWNKDGIPDLILSPESGTLYYFKNNLVTKN